MSTVDRRIGWLQRERHWRARGLRISTPINRSILEKEIKRENDARGRSKNEGCFASHVWARTGVLGLRRAATLAPARIIEWSLCAHLPGISIYLYIRLYTNAVYTITIKHELTRLTRKPLDLIICETQLCTQFNEITRVSGYFFSNLINYTLKKCLYFCW